MPQPDHAKIQHMLENVKLPIIEKSLSELKVKINISNSFEIYEITLICGFPIKYIQDELTSRIHSHIKNEIPNENINIKLLSEINSHAVQTGIQSKPNVKNVIAIASGKGGVGKSSCSANLAYALLEQGARVGILDADIYGPNQPMMCGTKDKPEGTEDKKIKPLMPNGLQLMSIGLLILQDDTPMIWRGPMVSTALQQLFNDTAWDNLDYLIIDLPPGTGDIQLTLAQKIPVSAAVIVTTPQDIALLDVKKAVKMFEKVNVPILGVIENMSVHICSQCGFQSEIFGKGGAEKIEKDYHLNMLGKIPLDIKIRQDLDDGMPTVIRDKNHDISKIYHELALKLSVNLALQQKNLAAKFPKIVVENK